MDQTNKSTWHTPVLTSLSVSWGTKGGVNPDPTREGKYEIAVHLDAGETFHRFNSVTFYPSQTFFTGAYYYPSGS